MKGKRLTRRGRLEKEEYLIEEIIFRTVKSKEWREVRKRSNQEGTGKEN